MPQVTITAPEGVRLNVTTQKREEKVSIVTRQGYDSEGNPAILHENGPKITVWTPQTVDLIATGSRDYEVNADQRIVVEAAS